MTTFTGHIRMRHTPNGWIVELAAEDIYQALVKRVVKLGPYLNLFGTFEYKPHRGFSVRPHKLFCWSQK